MEKEPKFNPEEEMKNMSIEEAMQFLQANVSNIQDRLKSIEDAPEEDKKELIMKWVDDVKGKDEYFAEQVEKTKDNLDEKIDEAKREGRLKDFLIQMDLSMGTGFDDYVILSKPLEEGVKQYLNYAPIIKRLIKVRDENGLSARDCFGMLGEDIGYFGRKLKEKIAQDRSVNQSQKDEWIQKIDQLMEK